MKMLNLLDMSGNQIQNFLVHNGDATSSNKLTAQPGRLVYDIADRSIYFGYDNSSTRQTEWSRLVDTAHIADIIGTYAIPVEREIIATKVEYFDDSVDILFYNYRNQVPFSVKLAAASDRNAGLLGSKEYEFILEIPNMQKELDNVSEIVVRNKPSWDSAFNWGNHADAGYAKAYKLENAVEASEHPVTGNVYQDANTLKSSTGRNDWTQREVVFDIVKNRLLCEYTITDGGTTTSAYVIVWSSYNTNKPKSYYEAEGNLLFVKGNASVYKYENNSWVLYFSGASQDVIKKIDAIRDALGLDTADGGVIDTWNEIRKFFANVNDETTLLGELSKKANDSDVIKKPSVEGVYGEVLTSNGNGTASWGSLKRVHTWVVDETSDLTKLISVSNTDVSVKLYKQVFPETLLSQNMQPMVHWNEVVADVDLVSMNKSLYVSITFGVRETGTYKAVII